MTKRISCRRGLVRRGTREVGRQAGTRFAVVDVIPPLQPPTCHRFRTKATIHSTRSQWLRACCTHSPRHKLVSSPDSNGRVAPDQAAHQHLRVTNPPLARRRRIPRVKAAAAAGDKARVLKSKRCDLPRRSKARQCGKRERFVEHEEKQSSVALLFRGETGRGCCAARQSFRNAAQ